MNKSHESQTGRNPSLKADFLGIYYIGIYTSKNFLLIEARTIACFGQKFLLHL